MLIVRAVVNLSHLEEFRQCFTPSAMAPFPVLCLAIFTAILRNVASRTLFQIDSIRNHIAIVCPTCIMALRVRSWYCKELIETTWNDFDDIKAFNTQAYCHVQEVVLLGAAQQAWHTQCGLFLVSWSRKVHVQDRKKWECFPSLGYLLPRPCFAIKNFGKFHH